MVSRSCFCNSVCSDAPASVPQDRIIIVGNQLPIKSHRSSTGKLNFSWDNDSLLLQLKDDDVSQKLLENFKCVPAYIPPELFTKYYHGFWLEYYGRTVSIKILPVGIHTSQLQSILNLPETQTKVAELRDQFLDQKVLLGVDDMDIFKGISLTLLAMEQLLTQHPEKRGRVVLVQIANPARGRGKDVHEVQCETEATVKRINEMFGRPGYQPVVLIDKSLQFFERIAYYVIAEPCLVTAVRDGMNLIPYEYIICRQGNPELNKTIGLDPSAAKKGMLVVSEFIGCSPSFSGAIRVNPWNIDAVTEAMACKDHARKRCWGIGFGVVALDPSFKKLSIEHIVSAYKRTKNRAILLDYDGTMVQPGSIRTTPSRETIDILNKLSNDPKNIVFLVTL
ncbi:unnamed protein product [Arabis nemorensis]|uniref:Uncharacterized protein n=1 Tax=Arabis nemorensis TaxID=586526 RepID=A0A565CG82_9BRAS|nr:unnamed protein product [Arabis nemorensis]